MREYKAPPRNPNKTKTRKQKKFYLYFSLPEQSQLQIICDYVCTRFADPEFKVLSYCMERVCEQHKGGNDCLIWNKSVLLQFHDLDDWLKCKIIIKRKPKF